MGASPGTSGTNSHLTAIEKFRALVLAIYLLIFGLNSTHTFSQAFTNSDTAAANATITYVRDVLPIVWGKCYSCHNDQARFLPNWSDYKIAFAHRVEIKRRVWDSWKGKYYKESMPVENSPQCLAMTEADRQTIKNWVEEGAVYGVSPAQGNARSKFERIVLGRRLFTMTCLPCHQVSGQGIPDRFPPLAASDFLNSDKNRVIQTLLYGRQGGIVVNGHAFNSSMPRFPLTDEEIANVLTYVYNSFGNSGKEVTPHEVNILRAQKTATSTESKKADIRKSSPWE
ncbi:MAG TPA: cytochrome c [Verrucomicrobiae bacterium]|nr:cytochrome c [Verrucomicrobiae bacterium]